VRENSHAAQVGIRARVVRGSNRVSGNENKYSEPFRERGIVGRRWTHPRTKNGATDSRRAEQARRDVFSPGRCTFLTARKTTSVLRSCPLSFSRWIAQTVRFSIVGRLIRSPTLQKLKKKKKKPWEIAQSTRRREDVIHENNVDRRVGVGVTVAAHGARKEGKERLAISNLTNNSAIGDFINGTAVPTEDEAFFNVFLTGGYWSRVIASWTYNYCIN